MPTGFPRTNFQITEEPMPTPRGRAAVQGGFARVHNPAKYTKWKALAAMLVGVHCRDPWHLRDGPVAVTLEVVATKARTSKLQHPSGDADNFAKAVLDAITQSEKLWHDDRQVVRLVVEKRFAQPGEAAHIRVSAADWQAAGVARADQLLHEALQGTRAPAERAALAREMLERWQAVLDAASTEHQK